MGLSPSKSKSTQTSNSTTTTTPNVPGFIRGPYENYYARLSALQNGGGSPSVIGPTYNQQRAFGGGLTLDRDSTSGARDATASLMNFAPTNVTAGQLASTDLSPYMNQYDGAVIQSLLGDWDQGNKLALNSLNAGTPSGAYGGSRQFVSAGQYMGDSARGLQSVLANQRAQSFLNAQNAASQDIGRRFDADTFNANQNMAGANFRLGAANQLGQLALGQEASRRSDLSLLADLGERERAIAFDNDPYNAQMRNMAQIATLLAAGNPEMFVGQTGNQQGTSTTTTPTGGWLAGLGSMFNGMGNMGVSFSMGGGGSK